MTNLEDIADKPAASEYDIKPWWCEPQSSVLQLFDISFVEDRYHKSYGSCEYIRIVWL